MSVEYRQPRMPECIKAGRRAAKLSYQPLSRIPQQMESPDEPPSAFFAVSPPLFEEQPEDRPPSYYETPETRTPTPNPATADGGEIVRITEDQVIRAPCPNRGWYHLRLPEGHRWFQDAGEEDAAFMRRHVEHPRAPR